MNIGAASLIHAWGRDMRLERDGIVLATFKGRFYTNRPETEQLDYSVDQNLYRIIAATEDFVGSPDIFPQKFDVIVDVARGLEYVVQQARSAGAETDEVFRILVKGGQV